ncbi:hypothetical protein BAU15_10425 [Enterococcus sp. JM4C]|uniref:hypothetical protein n=1 Tax=Candidatus Enterococcus huntleyi TaxID=1857217 RepID=UPI0013796CC8|nr:hypothetical protein [Enterococcus sp. JM4C]KAF1296193.1 hypothetical protein BAU15_10425 [Enterococcus sp. JM4C]
MFKVTYKFNPKKLFLIIHLSLLFLGMLLTIGRHQSLDTDFVILNAYITAHISNFSLTLLTFIGIGYTYLLTDAKFICINLLAVGLIIGNLLCETVMTFLNTPDIVDAYFGIAAVIIVYIFFLLFKKYGLVLIETNT